MDTYELDNAVMADELDKMMAQDYQTFVKHLGKVMTAYEDLIDNCNGALDDKMCGMIVKAKKLTDRALAHALAKTRKDK